MITKIKLFQVDNSADMQPINDFFESHEIVSWQVIAQIGQDYYRMFVHYEISTAEEEILKDMKYAKKKINEKHGEIVIG